MPARGDRMKVRFDEIDKTLRAYITFQQHPKIKQSQKSQNNIPKKKQVTNRMKSTVLVKYNSIQYNVN